MTAYGMGYPGLRTASSVTMMRKDMLFLSTG